MYPNLIVEATRKRITQIDMAKACNISRDSMRNKMTKDGRFTIEEAIAIKNYLFPECSLEYLFERK